MIVGIGCDIINHAISEKMEWNTNLDIRARIFSNREIALLPTNSKQQVSFLSGRYAAKEAVLKSLGTGMIEGVSLCEIEILRGFSQEPILKLSGLTHKIALEKKITKWHLSISHTNLMSVAFVIAEEN